MKSVRHGPYIPLGRLVLSAGLCLLVLAACRNDDPARLLASARAYQAKGDHRAAIIELKNVAQQQPDNGEARLLLGQSSLVVGDAPSAEKELRKALEFKQPPALVAPLLAQALLEQDKPNKVIEEFGGMKLETPQAEAELRARVGEAQLRTRELKEAGASFEAALTADPTNVRAQLGKSRLLALRGDTTQAGALVAKVIAANPKSAEALTLQGELKLFAGDREGALASLEQAVAANPNYANARFELISVLIAERKFDAAAAQVEAARAALGPDLRLLYVDALIAVGKKDYSKARGLAQQLLQRAPEHVPTLVLSGGVELEEKQYASAEATLQRALRLAPQHAGARALLVRSYLASNQPARAMEAAQPFLASGAAVDAPTQMLIAETYLANGQLKQAAHFFDAASKSPQEQPLARVRLGQIAMVKGDLEGGIRLLETAVADEGAPVQADLALIAGYTRSGESAKALQVAQGLVKKQPNSPMAYQVLGAVHGSRKEYAAARAAFDKALSINPAYLPAAAGLAQLDLADNKPADARARFEAVVAKDPKNEQALLALAEVMARTRAPAAEIGAVLKRAVNAKPDSPGARVALVNFHLQTNNPREALAAAQEATAALGQEPRVMDALGRAQLAAGETNQAIETFNRLAAAQPKSATPLLRLASAYAAQKELDKAVDALRRAQRIAPGDPAIARDLVVAYVATGKPDEALAQARAFQQANPKSAVGYILEGDVHASGKQWTAAERAYRDGLKANATSDGAALKLHGVLVASGRKAEAEVFARKWLADHPADGIFRGYVAEQALRANDLKTAVAQYQVLVTQQPDNAVALNNLAWASGQLGDPKALSYAERALKLAPDSAAVLDTIGVLLTAKGDTAKGLEHLARAVALAPDRHDIRLNYAKALLKAGRTEDARKELVQLQAVTQDFPGKSEIAALLKQ
jgi:putative PEP-CTERM system TPR-repeat lipoprotein